MTTDFSGFGTARHFTIPFKRDKKDRSFNESVSDTEPSKSRENLLKSIIKTCPKCGSKNISVVEYQDIMCMVCKKCGYDERDLYDIVPEERTSQKAKAEHTPYKAGGAKRVQKTS